MGKKEEKNVKNRNLYNIQVWKKKQKKTLKGVKIIFICYGIKAINPVSRQFYQLVLVFTNVS